MNMKLSEIIFDKKYLPRNQIHLDTINRYKEAYEIGEEFPPIVVQKENKILIDGFHRYEAQKQLGRTEVEVELLDIPEDQIYIEAVRRVGEHGLPPNKSDVDEQIFNLRVVHNLTLKEIGELVKKHESTVSKRLNANLKFQNLSVQDMKKVDRRVKYYDKREILNRIEGGQPETDIAEDLGISKSTVYRVKKEEEDHQKLLDKSPIVVCTNGEIFGEIFSLSSLGGKYNVEYNFQEDALYTTAREDPFTICGKFRKDYFDTYSVKSPLSWFLNVVHEGGKRKTKSIVTPMFNRETVVEASYVEMVLTGKKLDMVFQGRYGESKYSPGNVEVAERKLITFFETADDYGRVTDDDGDSVIIVGSPPLIDVIRSMPGPKGRVNLKFKNGVLNVSGNNQGWEFNRDIPIHEFDGGPVQLRVINELFKNVLSKKGRPFRLSIVNGKRKYAMVNIFDMSGRFYVNYIIGGQDVK